MRRERTFPGLIYENSNRLSSIHTRVPVVYVVRALRLVFTLGCYHSCPYRLVERDRERDDGR